MQISLPIVSSAAWFHTKRHSLFMGEFLIRILLEKKTTEKNEMQFYLTRIWNDFKFEMEVLVLNTDGWVTRKYLALLPLFDPIAKVRT